MALYKYAYDDYDYDEITAKNGAIDQIWKFGLLYPSLYPIKAKFSVPGAPPGATLHRYG